MKLSNDIDFNALAKKIKRWGEEFGFQQVGITDTDLSMAENRYAEIEAKGYFGDLDYMVKHGTKRSRPAELIPETLRIISVRMDYLPPSIDIDETLNDPSAAFISRYALGRDYHKVLRKRLQKLAKKIENEVGQFSYRAFVDSAPVLEKPLAEKAGLGWIGKHSNLINKQAGSWFFLGELYTDLPLPIDDAAEAHCGNCTNCIDVCPTQAIVAPFQVDARRCISYLTIELFGSIPIELRKGMGNRIYGCDDCQQTCPWNRFAQHTSETDFMPRHNLDAVTLLDLFSWDEATFLSKTEGSAIRRIGYERWLRNIAVALGNAEQNTDIKKALINKRSSVSEMVAEHIDWALQHH